MIKQCKNFLGKEIMKTSNNLHIKNKIYLNQFSKKVRNDLRNIFLLRR